MKTSGQRLRSGILMVEDAETVMRGSAGKTAVCGRNKLGGHYGRAGLGKQQLTVDIGWEESSQ